MNSHYLYFKPLYDSLLRGKEFMFPQDISYITPHSVIEPTIGNPPCVHESDSAGIRGLTVEKLPLNINTTTAAEHLELTDELNSLNTIYVESNRSTDTTCADVLSQLKVDDVVNNAQRKALSFEKGVCEIPRMDLSSNDITQNQKQSINEDNLVELGRFIEISSNCSEDEYLRGNITEHISNEFDGIHGIADSLPNANTHQEESDNRNSNDFVLKTHTNQVDTNYQPKETIKHMPCPNTIRHLVISGGGEMGFSFYAALRESNKSGFWSIENIETIYSTSVGSIFAVPIALLPHFGWDIYDDFVLKRPWDKVFNVHFSNFTSSFYKKGVFTKDTVCEMFKPVFNAIDMPLNITLQEFYEYTKIELHIMTTELTQFKLVDLSYKTHPDWELLDAVYSSAGLPILFAPHCVENHIYLDGGFISNYPINYCLAQAQNPNEILGFKRTYHAPKETDAATPKINTLVDYVFFIIYTMFSKLAESPKSVKHQVDVINYSPTINLYKMYNTFKSYNERVTLLEHGVRSWEQFYDMLYGNNSNQIGPEGIDGLTVDDESSNVNI